MAPALVYKSLRLICGYNGLIKLGAIRKRQNEERFDVMGDPDNLHASSMDCIKFGDLLLSWQSLPQDIYSSSFE